jgi:uncharacterized protein YjbI with pentapeptide repeats
MSASPPTSFTELLRRYSEGEREFSGVEIDQREDEDLAGVCLDDVILSEAFVTASFRGSSLRRADFRRANVKTCDFSGADLTDADFRDAALCSTKFAGAIIDGVRIAGAYYHSHVFKEGDRIDW